MKLRPTLLLTLTLCSLSIAQTEVYRSVDRDGNAVFSDTPSENAKQLDVKPLNTVPPVTITEPEPIEKEEETAPIYKALNIISPTDQTIIPHGPGNFSISVSSEPALEGNHRIRLKLNGEIHGENASGSFAVTNARRGEHKLQAMIVDIDGNSQITSATTTIYVFRPIRRN